MSLKTAKLKYNIAYNVAYQVLNIIVPLITAPYVFRILGKEGIGLYGYSFSIAHYFSLFCMLGILNYGVREISMVSQDISKRTDKFLQIYAIQFCSGLLSLGLYVLLVLFFVHSNQNIFLIQAIIVLSSMLDISWFLFGMEDFRITTKISTINKIVTTICIFVFIRQSSDVYIYTIILGLGSILNNIFCWLVVKKYVDFSLKGINEIKTHFKPILVLFIPVIAINIYKYIDKIMLGAILDVSDVGIFEAAEKLQNIPLCLIAAFGTVMLPRISNMVANKQSDSVNHYNLISFVTVFFLSTGMAFGLAAISNPFIPLFYGEGFYESISVLLYLLPSMIFVGWANIIRTQYLLPHRMDNSFCMSVIAGAIINIIANFILIPLYGAKGAAISTTIAEFTVCLYQSIVGYTQLALNVVLKKCTLFIFIGLFMYLSVIHISFDSNILTIVVRILLGMVLYVGLSFICYKKFKFVII